LESLILPNCILVRDKKAVSEPEKKADSASRAAKARLSRSQGTVSAIFDCPFRGGRVYLVSFRHHT
jgi:hypothetical protein